MEQTTDYYTVLGVEANASSEVIKKAFKHLALQYHPDVYKGEDAQERMRDILQAYRTLSDPDLRRSYDLHRSRHVPGQNGRVPAASSSAADDLHSQRQSVVFPVLNDDVPAQIDLGEVTYLLSAREVRRLKEDGMLRGAMVPSMSHAYYCHRCRYTWKSASLPKVCPNCQAPDWREYLLLRCQHCQAVFESEQIRYEVGALRYGDGSLCPPYELFPLCPSCGKAGWCPAEEARLYHVRDRAARKSKWRRRFGLE